MIPSASGVPVTVTVTAPDTTDDSVGEVMTRVAPAACAGAATPSPVAAKAIDASQTVTARLDIRSPDSARGPRRTRSTGPY